MRIDSFELLKPRTLEDALQALAEHGSEARVLAGGSDLLVRMKQGVASPRYVVAIEQLRELKYIHDREGHVVIGAGTTLSVIERSALVRAHLPALATASAKVASYQIRNMATLGGNVCLETMCWYYNQSRRWKAARPACYKAGGETCHVVRKPQVCFATHRSDTATALVALGASVRIRSERSERTVLLEELFSGQGRAPLSLEPGEMLVEFRLPAMQPHTGNTYLKVSHRNAVDYPLAAVGAFVKLSQGNGRCEEVRIALGAVGAGPLRSHRAEAILRGQEITPQLLAEAAAAAKEEARPVNNMPHGSPTYRRRMIQVAGSRALAAAIEQAKRN